MNKKSHIDRLYFWLGLFTNFYLIAIAADFFSNLHLRYPQLETLLEALSEPYLGALAVYTVLKEIRKRRSGGFASLHRGELFVAAWLLLLVFTTAAVILTESYYFDAVYKLILTNSLASLMIYLGSRISKP